MFYFTMLKYYITQKKLKRKFFGALLHTSENFKPEREATESDVREHCSNQIQLSCSVRRNNWISFQRDVLSMKESRKTEKNVSWTSKFEGMKEKAWS